MTTYDTANGSPAPGVPPTPNQPPQLHEKKKLGRKIGGANVARILLGAVLALMLLTTWIANNPGIHSGSTPSDWKASLAEAALTNELNDGETKGAPQQTVVNGWYLNDIAAVQAAQNTYIAGSSLRNGNLLTIIGFALAGELIIRGVESARRKQPASA